MTPPSPSGRNPFADEDVNPYSSPHDSGGRLSGGGQIGIWRKGRVLIVHREARLPAICVKTNQPADSQVVCRMSWHHPAVYLSFFLMPVVYVVLVFALRQKATLQLPVSDEYAQQRARLRQAAAAIGIVGGLMLLAGLVLIQRGDAFVLLLCGGALLILGWIWNSRSRPLHPILIDEDFVHATGAHAEYLDRLPVWPYA